MANTLNTMRSRIDVLASDASTPLAVGIAASAEDLQGRALELAQMISSSTTHRFVVRTFAELTSDCYLVCEGKQYIVDYLLTLDKPLRGTYTAILAHKVKDGAEPPSEYDIDGGTF